MKKRLSVSVKKNRITASLLMLSIFAATLILPACSSTKSLPAAQSTAEFYQKYHKQNGFKGISLPVGLVTRYLSTDADSTVQAALANMTSVRVLSFTPQDRKAQRMLDRGLTQELDHIFQQASYVPLPQLEEAPQALQFRLRQANNQVQEIVGYRKTGNSFLMLQVNGRFTRQQVEQLLKKVDPDVLISLL